MPFLKNVLGLDLGSHSLKAVEFKQTLRGFEAVQMRTLPRADDQVALGELVGRFVRMHRLPTEHVVSALPGDRVSARRFSFPFRDRKKLSQAVPFEVEGDTPFDLEDIMVDWEIVGGDRNHAEVVATIAQRNDVSEFLAALHEGSCDPRTLEAEGLALGNLCGVFDLPGTRLLIDLGHRKSTCCLLSEGHAVAARTIPIGGAALTAALAQDLGVGLEEAEREKCESRLLGRPGGVPRQAGGVLDRLSREILRTLGAFESVVGSLGAGAVTELTIFGGTAQLEGIEDYLTERAGVRVARLGLPDPGHGESLVAGGPPILFAPAIALGLRGTAQARTRMNFRQDEFAVRLDLSAYGRDFVWTGALAAIACVLALIGFATSTALESARASDIESQVESFYSGAFPSGSPPADPVAAMREGLRSANERAEFLGVYRGNLSALDVLAEISKRVPTDLDIELEELSIDRQIVRMRVYAKSFEAADRLGAELAKFPPFAQARIGAIETDRKRSGKRFNVTISLAATEPM